VRRPGVVTGCAFNGRSQDRAFANVSVQSFNTGNPLGWALARRQARGGTALAEVLGQLSPHLVTMTHSLDTQRLARENT
jgi:hypothetical protein